MMDEIDFNVDNYDIDELVQLLNFDTTPTNEDMILHKITFLTKKYKEKPKYIKFFNEIGKKLILNFEQFNKETWQESYETDGSLSAKVLTQQYLDNEKDSKNLILDKKRDIIGIKKVSETKTFATKNNTQGERNPVMINQIRRIVNFDSQYREILNPISSTCDINGNYTNNPSNINNINHVNPEIRLFHPTNYTVNLNQPLTNVVDLSLESVEIPNSWYVFSSDYGTNALEFDYIPKDDQLVADIYLPPIPMEYKLVIESLRNPTYPSLRDPQIGITKAVKTENIEWLASDDDGGPGLLSKLEFFSTPLTNNEVYGLWVGEYRTLFPTGQNPSTEYKNEVGRNWRIRIKIQHNLTGISLLGFTDIIIDGVIPADGVGLAKTFIIDYVSPVSIESIITIKTPVSDIIGTLVTQTNNGISMNATNNGIISNAITAETSIKITHTADQVFTTDNDLTIGSVVIPSLDIIKVELVYENKKIEIENGNYQPDELMYVINNLCVLNYIPIEFTYSSRTGKVSITNTNTRFETTIKFYIEDSESSGCSAQKTLNDEGSNTPSPGNKIGYNLGWLLGFRVKTLELAPSEKKVGKGLLDTFGPKYFILTLDDFNNNKPNKDLISLVDNSAKNFKLPDYYNSQTMDGRFGVIRDPISPKKIVSNTYYPGHGAGDADAANWECQDTAGPVAKRGCSENDLNRDLRSNLTKKQQYTVDQLTLANTSGGTVTLDDGSTLSTVVNRYKSPNSSDLLVRIPITTARQEYTKSIVFRNENPEYTKRVYFGPVKLRKFKIRLLNDKGFEVNLNDQDWSFSIHVTQLYQF